MEAIKGESKVKARADSASPERGLIEWPEISLGDILKLYQKDPMAKACVDGLASQVVTGFYTTCNPEYYRGEKAKEYIDKFCEQVGLDQLLLDCAKTLIACGNDFWLKVTPEKIEEFVRISPEAVVKAEIAKLDPQVKIPYKVESYTLAHNYGGQTLKAEALIHFRINVPPGSAFGVGVLQVLLERLTLYGYTRPSVAEAKAAIESIIPKIFEKYAGPDVLACLEDASAEDIATFKRTIKTRAPEGNWLFYTGKGDVKPIQIDPRARFEYYIEHIIDQYAMGLETPMPKLFTRTGYTEASAKVAKELGECIVRPLQRYIKRTVEREIFKPVLEQAGFDPEKAGIRLNWGTPKTPEYRVEDVLKAWEIGLIRTDEGREILKKIGWELTEPQTAEQQAMEEARRTREKLRFRLKSYEVIEK